MQSAEDVLGDDLAAGALRPEECRIAGRVLAKRSMRTPMIKIINTQRHHSTPISFVEDN
jgi:hypothetical protein